MRTLVILIGVVAVASACSIRSEKTVERLAPAPSTTVVAALPPPSTTVVVPQ